MTFDRYTNGEIIEVRNRGYQIVKMPADGLCGYHCMDWIADANGVPRRVWKPHMDFREWATDMDFQIFCNVTGLMIQVFETYRNGELCMQTLIVPNGLDERRLPVSGRVLIHQSHYDILEPVACRSINR